ncbi:hypothetical protein [Hoylesella shahii]|uniref:SPASM domain peptide maturase of grasp-with-spasm system n=1 Tax=Hoylesella shahii DSM 15611 = JCM 12083 TaxID=1122991 RepID=A0A318HS17_9BACT|nr:hypothetical protein [Hoylesella shahii]PXX20913.1 hypothetical protein EJ73_02080 [Hoylesella shahii DSM 15611 = JCM 12083]
MDTFFKLFSCSKVVRGKKLGAVYLLNRARIERIPLDVCDLIEELQMHSIKSVQSNYSGNIVEQWVQYLWRNNVGHFTEEPNCFCESPIEYAVPSIIQRAQIEFSSKSSYNVAAVADKLDGLLCKHLEVRVWGESDYDMLNSFFKCFKSTCIRSINVYIESYSKDLIHQDIPQIFRNNPKISFINVFNSKEKFIQQDIYTLNGTMDSLIGEKWDLTKTLVNFSFFTESLSFNTFYNKKVAIDKDGLIKNDLSLQESFGNVRELNIEEVVLDPFFSRYWKINVDCIENIKDSELRYAIYPAREIEKKGDKYFIKD